VNAFRIRLADLVPGKNRVHLEAPASAVGLDPEVWVSPIDLDLELDRQGDQIAVRGTGRTRVEEDCSRCMRHFESPVVFQWSAFADRAALGRPGEDEELDEYVIRHDGRWLDLDAEVREQAILARPMQSLCRPDCAGLCPRCGADRNQVACNCREPEPQGSAFRRIRPESQA